MTCMIIVGHVACLVYLGHVTFMDYRGHVTSVLSLGHMNCVVVLVDVTLSFRVIFLITHDIHVLCNVPKGNNIIDIHVYRWVFC